MFRLILFLFGAVIIIIATGIVYPVYAVMKRINRRKADMIALHFVQWGFKLGCFLCGVTCVYKGLEYLPEDGEGVMFASNHRGLFDAILTYKVVKGRTGNLSTNEYATPLGAQKSGSTEEFGRYFVGANPFIYSVNIPATVGGSVSARLYLQEEPWSDGYAYNDYVQLTVTPNAGYQFENMTVTDENSNPINVVDNAFRMPASNVTITATFTAIPFTVTVPESFEHGTVECDKETADYGETVTLTVTPDEGYELNALTVTVVGDEPNTYTFEMPAAPVTVNATFVETIITAVTDLTKTQPTGQRYNIMGQPVGKDYKGIVIEDGKKKVVK